MAENHDLLGITAKLGDVGLHPLECGDHVHKTIVARDAFSAFGGQTRMREETQCCQAIVDGHDNYVAIGRQMYSIQQRPNPHIAGIAHQVSTTVNVEHDRMVAS